MKKKVLTAVGVLTLAVSLVGCESMERAKKDMASEFGGGIQRDIQVVTESGKVIYEAEGKFDIEYSDGKLKYIDDAGKVHIVYLGNSATVITNEK